MIAILIVAALFLSLVFSVILKKPHIAILLVVLASSRMSGQATSIICVILPTVILQFLHTFFLEKKNKSFLLIALVPFIYIVTIFLIQPYKLNTGFYLGYVTALFIFAWVLLVDWDFKSIGKFLTFYGLYLVLAGFVEKVISDTERVGEALTVATAYAVVLVSVWSIWIVNCFLSKTISKKIILLGTFFVFLAVIFSGTRMGFLGIFLGLGLCTLSVVLARNEKTNIIKITTYSLGIIAVLLLLGIVVWNLLPNDLYIKKTFSSLLAGKLDESNMGRIFFWISAIDIINDNKILGIGAGNFPEKIKLLLPQNITMMIGVNENTHAHNIYLIMLSEHGIVGFLILICFAFACISQPFFYFLKNKQNFEFYALLSGFIVMAVLGLFDATPMYIPTAGFAALFFGVCASFRNKRKFYEIERNSAK